MKFLRLKSNFKIVLEKFNTGYSEIWCIFQTKILIRNLIVSIHDKLIIRDVAVEETPHSIFALELRNNFNISSSNLQISEHNVGLIVYKNYIENYYPDQNSEDACDAFVELFLSIKRDRRKSISNVKILVQPSYSRSYGLHWKIIDGLHRAAILMALGENNIDAVIHLKPHFCLKKKGNKFDRLA